MTGEKYQLSIDHLGMTQVGSARFFGVDERTPRKWIAGDLIIPAAVSMLLAVMVEYDLDPLAVLALDGRVAS